MDKRIRALYDDAVLAEAVARFGIDREHLRLLDGFESFIYAYQKDDRDHILRVGHSLHRTADQVRGEIEWLNYVTSSPR